MSFDVTAVFWYLPGFLNPEFDGIRWNSKEDMDWRADVKVDMNDFDLSRTMHRSRICKEVEFTEQPANIE